MHDRGILLVMYDIHWAWVESSRDQPPNLLASCQGSLSSVLHEDDGSISASAQFAASDPKISGHHTSPMIRLPLSRHSHRAEGGQTSFPFPSESSSWQTVVPPPLRSLLWEVRASRLVGNKPAGASCRAAGFQPLKPHRPGVPDSDGAARRSWLGLVVEEMKRVLAVAEGDGFGALIKGQASQE